MPPRFDRLRDFWTAAGLRDLGARKIAVQRTFTDDAYFWAAIVKRPSLGPGPAAMSRDQFAALQARVRSRLSASTPRLAATRTTRSWQSLD